MNRLLYLVFLFFFFLISCNNTELKKEEKFKETPYNFSLPNWAPIPVIPDENPITEEKVILGKKLFNDPIFSKNGDVSCATCHQEKLAFTDGKRISIGTEGKVGFRNAPSILNTAYNSLFFADGGVRTLELQVLVPSDTHFEFDLSIPELIDKLKKDSVYLKLFKEAFDTPPTVYGITRSIAAYERTLVSFNSKYDEFFANKDSTIFNPSELRGLRLFFSARANCSSCHVGIHFTDRNFYNIGLKTTNEDPGRIRVTTKKEDFGKFKTPSLRNVEITSPYMHDGRFSSLMEVIEHYKNGGEKSKNKDHRVQPLQLNDEETNDLINFLKTLTDKQFRVS